MKERDVSRLLTDHYDRLVYPPQPPGKMLESVRNRARRFISETRKRVSAPAHTAELKP